MAVFEWTLPIRREREKPPQPIEDETGLGTPTPHKRKERHWTTEEMGKKQARGQNHAFEQLAPSPSLVRVS